MTISSRVLHAIPRPSVWLFLGLCFLSAAMMMGFLLMRPAHNDAAVAAVHHRSDIAADRSKD